ncbi:MAG: hypothetical protein ABI411_10940 [Tahibacter sp.]
MTSRNEAILLSVGLTGAVIASLLPFAVVPQFAAMFKNFGAELPLATRWAVHYHSVLLILPVLVGMAWFFWPRRAFRGLAACVIGVSSLVLTIPLLLFALYLPLVRLAAIS